MDGGDSNGFILSWSGRLCNMGDITVRQATETGQMNIFRKINKNSDKILVSLFAVTVTGYFFEPFIFFYCEPSTALRFLIAFTIPMLLAIWVLVIAVMMEDEE